MNLINGMLKGLHKIFRIFMQNLKGVYLMIQGRLLYYCNGALNYIQYNRLKLKLKIED